MKHYTHVVFLLSVSIILFQGCKRKAPDDVPKDSAEVTGEIKAESGTAMALLEAGRFTMGDENEVDATPHEVAVSSFYIDKYPVTQEQYKKVMGENPSRWKADKNLIIITKKTYS